MKLAESFDYLFCQSRKPMSDGIWPGQAVGIAERGRQLPRMARETHFYREEVR